MICDPGDCSALVPLDDLKNNELEISNGSSTEQTGVEEEEQPQVKQNLKSLHREVEGMKQRIRKINLVLKLNVNECSIADECIAPAPEIAQQCAASKDIVELQQANRQLKYQLSELIGVCNNAQELAKQLRSNICHMSKDMLRMHAMIEKLISWKMELEHEFGLCAERFKYLEKTKCETREGAELMAKLKARPDMNKKSLLTKKLFATDVAKFTSELEETKLYCESVKKWMKKNMKVVYNCSGPFSLINIFQFSDEVTTALQKYKMNMIESTTSLETALNL